MINLSENIDSDRAAFAEHAQRFWVVLEDKGSILANLESERCSEIVQKWVEKGGISVMIYII